MTKPYHYLTVILLYISLRTACHPCQTLNCKVCPDSEHCALCMDNYILQIDRSDRVRYCRSVSCNIDHCQLCYQDGICAMCVEGYGVTSDGVCLSGYVSGPCEEGCAVCASLGCELCQFGYQLSQRKCTPTHANTIPGCRSYLYQNQCQLCIQGYIVHTNGSCIRQNNYIEQASSWYKPPKIFFMQLTSPPTSPSLALMQAPIQCNVTNCTSCISPNFCGRCSGNLSVNYQGNLCIECTLSNCQLCAQNNSCVTCLPGYQLVPGNFTCILCTIHGCALCKNSTSCENCSTSYILNKTSGICDLCLQPCLSCAANSTSYCLTCSPPYSNESSQGVCYTCSVPNCFSCNVADPSNCTECNDNYTRKDNGTTCSYKLTCSSSCVSCTSDSVCLACKPGYAVNTTEKDGCFPCNSTNCLTCSSTNASVCVVCNAGYYSNGGGICTLCPFTNCQTCNSQFCLTFQPTFGQYPVIYNNVTYPAIPDPGCMNFSDINPLACITCSPGYTLTPDRICVPCLYPCLQCASTSPQICLACYQNAIFNQSQSTCQICTPSSRCLTCQPTNLSQCTSCPAGSVLDNNTLVCSGSLTTGCPSFCLTCLNSTVCSVCDSGYSKNLQGQCLPCINSCRLCPDNNQGLCLSCGSGFYLGPLGNCKQCSAFCTSCYKQGCLTCTAGYYLSPNLTCIPLCLPPCASCLANTTTTCTSCLLGYFFNGQQSSCTPQLSDCVNGSCYYCPLGYVPSGSPNYECVQCTPSSNCARCNFTNVSVCLTCQNGFYMNSNTQCFACPTNCTTCTSNSSCNTCNPGYYIPAQPVQSPSICLACQPPCLTCSSYSTACISCIDGYQLSGWSCQSNFNYIFSLILNVTQAQFYNSYQALLLALVGPLNNGNNIGAVTVNSIATLSTSTIQGTISTNQQSNTNGAGTQFYGILNMLKTGTIASMPILYYQLQPSGGVIPTPAGDEPNLGLILGISLPVAIICMFMFYLVTIVVSILVYRKISIKAPEQEPGQLSRRQLYQSLQANA